MPKKLLQVTPELTERICVYIRAGGFPHVAAEACGVSREIFEDWLRRARVRQPKAYFKAFLTAINQAKAHARLQAEIAAKSDNPIAWLRSGPGKETKEAPGWTRTVGPQVSHDNRQLNLMVHPEMLAIFQTILHLLAPYPEARAAVANALAGSPPKEITCEPSESK